MSFGEDKHLDVCQSIEIGLKREYDRNTSLTDALCILGLDNAKIAIKQRFGYAKNESVSNAEEIKGIIEWCVSLGLERIDRINALSLKEYVARLDKIKGSVQNHSRDRKRGYYDFVARFLP